ncbi:MAG: hypothetical protein LBG28_04975 [Tannerella sp.]|jgi:hypothetical protein|nr:hypothetical protein [Tannerella sp.]
MNRIILILLISSLTGYAQDKKVVVTTTRRGEEPLLKAPSTNQTSNKIHLKDSVGKKDFDVHFFMEKFDGKTTSVKDLDIFDSHNSGFVCELLTEIKDNGNVLVTFYIPSYVHNFEMTPRPDYHFKRKYFKNLTLSKNVPALFIYEEKKGEDTFEKTVDHASFEQIENMTELKRILKQERRPYYIIYYDAIIK